MKNLENMNAINEMEMTAFAGGSYGDPIPGFPEIVPDMFPQNNNVKGASSQPLPFPHTRIDLTDLPCDDPYYKGFGF